MGRRGFNRSKSRRGTSRRARAGAIAATRPGRAHTPRCNPRPADRFAEPLSCAFEVEAARRPQIEGKSSRDKQKNAAMDDLPIDVILTVARQLAAQDPPSLLWSTCASSGFRRIIEKHPEVWKEAVPFLASEGDALVEIHQKLTVQDPLSFLRAVASCKAFEAAAETNPALWKEAFHGSAKEQRIWALQTFLSEEGAKLDSELEILGGYNKSGIQSLYSDASIVDCIVEWATDDDAKIRCHDFKPLSGILQKLAAQDPPSFLQAVASCKAFWAAAETNPALWKEAFHGSAKEQSIWALRNYLTEEGAILEAELEVFGGYKRVLEATWANQVVEEHEQNPQAKRESESFPGTSGFSSSRLSLYSSRFVVLVRLLGVLVAYGVHSPKLQTGKIGVIAIPLHLQPLYSFKEIGQALGDIYAEGRAGTDDWGFGSVSRFAASGPNIARTAARLSNRGQQHAYGGRAIAPACVGAAQDAQLRNYHFCRDAMDDLPADALVEILQKLAVQDPLSLLRAVASCKAFEAAGERNPALWKEAFHGSAKEQRIPALQTFLSEEGAKLDAELEIFKLGGYKHFRSEECPRPA
ncbi:hypothetical protein KFL_001020220 [Klebsormidium nitens]|uniref:F-box domain-containing protein n=1 Tax=Klebsormidium nitens TaxID=105231 RepID=A0A1Y1HWK7_KLENI|nr:hypothetical protein KFL_001020220 [Klebsormidium nitens]|eukprot:GAQ82172.1 hypothetical protein KFL_001020220 [Klebsormidium nitens]